VCVRAAKWTAHISRESANDARAASRTGTNARPAVCRSKRLLAVGHFLASSDPMPTENETTKFRSSIDHFMTPNPHCIGRDQPLSLAHQMMRSLRVRHLPVLDRGHLVGILSQRDLFFVETLRDVDPAKVTVEDAMSPDVYVVPPEKLIGEVATVMAEHKFGCTVIARGEQIQGIFTTNDALRVLVGIVEAWR
jgi:acetoin utilization protein AcuB